MSPIEIERLLREISPEAPSGENIEYDPDFIKLESDMEGTPAVEVGKKVVQEAKDPNWPKVQESAVELLERTHDLRIAVSLTRALARTEGFEGIHSGLNIIYGLVERFWDTLHPQLNPEDGSDPVERINALEYLGDWDAIMAPLMKARLCAVPATSNAPAIGPINLRQYRIANGKLAELAVSDEEKKSAPSPATIEAAFANCDLEDLRKTGECVRGSVIALQKLKEYLNEKVGAARAPDFEHLRELIEETNNLLQNRLSRRGVPDPTGPKDSPKTENSGLASRTGDGDSSMPDPGRTEPTASEVRRRDMIEDRRDVLRFLELICAYYDKNEPASPVPLLLKRAMRLVEMNFLEILQDMAPTGLAQAQLLTGGGAGEVKK